MGESRPWPRPSPKVIIPPGDIGPPVFDWEFALFPYSDFWCPEDDPEYYEVTEYPDSEDTWSDPWTR